MIIFRTIIPGDFSSVQKTARQNNPDDFHLFIFTVKPNYLSWETTHLVPSAHKLACMQSIDILDCSCATHIVTLLCGFSQKMQVLMSFLKSWNSVTSKTAALFLHCGMIAHIFPSILLLAFLHVVVFVASKTWLARYAKSISSDNDHSRSSNFLNPKTTARCDSMKSSLYRYLPRKHFWKCLSWSIPLASPKIASIINLPRISNSLPSDSSGWNLFYNSQCTNFF